MRQLEKPLTQSQQALVRMDVADACDVLSEAAGALDVIVSNDQLKALGYDLRYLKQLVERLTYEGGELRQAKHYLLDDYYLQHQAPKIRVNLTGRWVQKVRASSLGHYWFRGKRRIARDRAQS